MISRRHLAAAAGAGTAVAALVGAASAQTPPPGETTLDRIRRTRKLRIAAIAGAAPYYLKDPASGQWKGFYIDISKALADELEVDLDITESTWGNTILDLQSNKIDVFFGLNPMPKRALVIDFSVPVFSNAFTMITRKGVTARSWAELNTSETRIAVDAGAAHDQVVSRICPKAQIIRLKTTDEATASLQTGRVDAQCLILMLALTALKKVPTLGQLVVPAPVFGTTSNAGFRREADKTWRDYVNTWIDFNRGLGLVRQAILSNMQLVGLTEADMPAGVSL